jgi:hypothetical protein
MSGRQRRIDYEKFQISVIVRNNPGITRKELLKKLSMMEGTWYLRKLSRRLNKMDSIKCIRWFNKDINRYEYKHFIK